MRGEVERWVRYLGINSRRQIILGPKGHCVVRIVLMYEIEMKLN